MNISYNNLIFVFYWAHLPFVKYITLALAKQPVENFVCP